MSRSGTEAAIDAKFAAADALLKVCVGAVSIHFQLGGSSFAIEPLRDPLGVAFDRALHEHLPDEMAASLRALDRRA